MIRLKPGVVLDMKHPADWSFLASLVACVAITGLLVLLVPTIIWFSGGFMKRGCDLIERQVVHIHNGPTITADVCVGAWR
jgi:hypothetical protein